MFEGEKKRQACLFMVFLVQGFCELSAVTLMTDSEANKPKEPVSTTWLQYIIYILGSFCYPFTELEEILLHTITTYTQI